MEDDRLDAVESDLCVHIFAVSAAMVGACLTVIGLFRVITALKSVDSLGDDLLVLDAFLFLGACLLAYVGLRSPRKQRRRRVEKAADLAFLGGLCLMACICGLITYAIV